MADSWSPSAGAGAVSGYGGHTYFGSRGDVDGSVASSAGGNGVHRVASGFELVRSVTNTSSTARLEVRMGDGEPERLLRNRP